MPDKKLLITIILLLIFGFIMSFSASIYFSEKIFANPFYITIRQGIYIIIALFAGFLVLKIPMSKLEKLSLKLFIFNLILLTLVFLPVIGVEINGSRRWISLGFLNFQPSEMMKLVIILFMAGFLVRQDLHVISSHLGLLKTIFILFILALLLLFETDVGAFFIISSTALLMLFVAEVKLKHFLLVIVGGIASLSLVVFSIPYTRKRILAFLDPWKDPHGDSYQLIQSLISIGSGEIFGVGLGGGVQKTSFLPDAHTDFIFAVIGEELGIIGMLFVIFCFSYIIYRGFIISKTALTRSKHYSSYTAYGISIWLAIQVSINIGVNLGLLPTKGLTLPLISFGGSSMVMSVISLAILLRIDIENKRYRNYG